MRQPEPLARIAANSVRPSLLDGSPSTGGHFPPSGLDGHGAATRISSSSADTRTPRIEARRPAGPRRAPRTWRDARPRDLRGTCPRRPWPKTYGASDAPAEMLDLAHRLVPVMLAGDHPASEALRKQYA